MTRPRAGPLWPAARRTLEAEHYSYSERLGEHIADLPAVSKLGDKPPDRVRVLLTSNAQTVTPPRRGDPRVAATAGARRP